MIEKFIEDFNSQIKRPNVFLFSLLLANKFRGEILVNFQSDDSMPDVIVLIGTDFYDMFGKIDSDIINVDDYTILNRLSLLYNTRFYEYVKWSFVYEENDDEMYFNDVN